VAGVAFVPDGGIGVFDERRRLAWRLPMRRDVGDAEASSGTPSHGYYYNCYHRGEDR
jgi:hypothetical protein